MTPRERSRFEQLLGRVAELEPRVKDPEAEALVEAALARYPSLAYWLAHRVLLLDRALANADAQIDVLRAELRNRSALAVRAAGAAQADGTNAIPRTGEER
jgi:hypothetical protein